MGEIRGRERERERGSDRRTDKIVLYGPP